MKYQEQESSFLPEKKLHFYLKNKSSKEKLSIKLYLSVDNYTVNSNITAAVNYQTIPTQSE